MRHFYKRCIGTIFALCLISVGVVPAQAMPQLLVDMQTGAVLYDNEAGVPWHPASLTKLMTALIAIEAIETGRARLDTPVVTSANALKVEPSKMGLPVDTAISLKDALYALIVKSANDMAVAIGETLAGSESNFVAIMNQRAQELGLTGTYYVNSHGLHDVRQVTTARDMAILALTIRARYPQYDGLFSTRTLEVGTTKSLANNELLNRYYGTDGMKTGFVCASGLNIVTTVARNGRHLMAVLLGANTSRERGEMTAQLLSGGFNGSFRGSGQNLVQLSNRFDLEPVNMRTQMCGAEAASYKAAREAAYPLGLAGQDSNLEAPYDMPSYRVSILGRTRDVPLPRARPAGMASIMTPTEVIAAQTVTAGVVGGGADISGTRYTSGPVFPPQRPAF